MVDLVSTIRRPPLFAPLRRASVYPLLLVMTISGCALCPEEDFDRVITEKTCITFYPLGLYEFNEDELGSSRFDEIGIRGRRHICNGLYVGADYQGTGSPLSGRPSSVFYEGILDIHRLLLTADYELVLSRAPLLRLGFGLYPGYVIPVVNTDEDLEEDLKKQGIRVSQRMEGAFDLRMGVKLIWNPVTERTAWRPGYTLHAGYEYTGPMRARSRAYDSAGTIERSSEAVDLGGLFLLLGIEF
jgi:hypothetical protein